MSTKTALVTYDDYRHLPDDGYRYEIIGGELIMTPAPITIHQRISRILSNQLTNFVEKNNLGEIFYAPTDVVFSMTEVVQPDILFISKERSQIITKKNIIAAPDLVIEILSDSTEVLDRKQKKELYEKYGVKEYWIVDIEKAMVEQYILQDGFFELNGALASSNKVNSKIIAGFSIPIGEIFKN